MNYILTEEQRYSPPHPLSERILEAIGEIDGRPYNQTTGTFVDGLATNPRAKLQVLAMAEAVALPDGELPPQLAVFNEI